MTITPGIGIPIYAFLMGCSILIVIGASWIKMHRRNIPTKTLEWGSLIIVFIGVCGGRIWYVINNWSYYDSLLKIIALWDGGMAIQGAIMAGCVVGFLIFRSASLTYHISMWVYIDCILPNILLGQAIGRWGNFFNQEILGWDHGQPFSWLPSFINNYLHNKNESSNIYRHPLFLYESLITFLSWIILTFIVPKIGFWISKKPWKIEAEKYYFDFSSNCNKNCNKYHKIKHFFTNMKIKQKQKKSFWNNAYFTYQPKIIAKPIRKPYKKIKISAYLPWWAKYQRQIKNYFYYLINPFFYNAKPLNNSYNPQNYHVIVVGTIGSLYFLVYGVIRLIMEPLRQEITIMRINGIPTTIIISFLWVFMGISLVGFAYIAKNKFRKEGWFYERQY